MRRVDPAADAELLHRWVTDPKARFWGMLDADVGRVEREYRELDAFIGSCDGEPAFLLERYDPAEEPVGATYPVQEGDVGMHFLVAPTDRPVHGFTRRVIEAVMAFLFADPATRRVVVEPDVRNHAVHALNDAVGFQVAGEVELPDKCALLSFCTREDWLWAEANRGLVAKALAEFAHERLIEPEPQPDGTYTVGTWRFSADRLPLDHWRIKDVNGPNDALELVVELREQLGLEGERLGLYLEEVTSTLSSLAFKLGKAVGADELASADFQTIEAGMTEGHPCFVANSGRLGFSSEDSRRYAPEAASPVRLAWLAAHRDDATASGEYDVVTAPEYERFGVDPAESLLIPAHPWQWRHRLSVTFAADRRLRYLGESDDEYLPQQSIRTFFNATRPERDYVKTALSVVNMGFVRGLSAKYMEGTPAINDWVADLIAGDEQLAGFSILRERAAVGYRPHRFEGDPYAKMLAALWRESPVPTLAPGERLATMASLLHVDRDGNSLAAALIERSGLDPEVWLRRYLDVYLRPLLHCLYAHDLAFMPHGENIILVLRDHVPVRAILKDVAEEIVLMDPDRPLPPQVERIRAEVPDELKPLSILTDVFDCFFRFLDAIVDADLWSLVADCVRDYEAFVPEVAGRYDLFTETFALSCLNRLQLRDSRQMVDLQDPAGSLQFAGTLDNPLAARLSGLRS